MCDDVSVNKSLFGNERETPSIRSSRSHGRPPSVISGNASAAGAWERGRGGAGSGSGAGPGRDGTGAGTGSGAGPGRVRGAAGTGSGAGPGRVRGAAGTGSGAGPGRDRGRGRGRVSALAPESLGWRAPRSHLSGSRGPASRTGTRRSQKVRGRWGGWAARRVRSSRGGAAGACRGQASGHRGVGSRFGACQGQGRRAGACHDRRARRWRGWGMWRGDPGGL
jgi:hypothetical protein